MKYIGNYKDWIDPKWKETILSTHGKQMPREWEAETESQLNEIKNIRNAGYNMNVISWWFYFKNELDFELSPPWCKNEIMYWFSKTTPGQFIPLLNAKALLEFNFNLYLVALQDYEPGHVFIYGEHGDMLQDYKVGDVFQFDDASVRHGSANISTNTRVMLQIAEVI